MTTPIWAGPESAADNGGITFSLLSRFLCCPERFRVKVVEGLGPADDFNHRIEYGQMWHVCEEALARGPDPTNKKGIDPWEKPLVDYAASLSRKYPLRREQIAHWYNVCRVQFPVYVDYWRKHPDVKNRRPLLQEQVFCVPYTLPSGRTIYLRGKWDSVDLIDGGIYLQENKTKGDVHEEQLQRQLTFDLQTMLYLVALKEWRNTSGGDVNLASLPVRGVRYNVIRRPLSGGKHSIVRHKGKGKKPEETHQAFYQRLGAVINDDRGFFFMRWKVEVQPNDVKRFRRECLDPILEHLCQWWRWVSWVYSPDAPKGYRDLYSPRVDQGIGIYHYRHPFGVYNALDEGGSSDLDEYLATGSKVGLAKIDTLFPELHQ